jgi:hypothetical protein
VWTPYCIGDINSIESVQRSFTYKVFIKCNIPYNANTRYSDRLSMLCLERLELRRLYFDLLEMFKCVKGFSNVYINDLIAFSAATHTRGHRFKLFVNLCKTDVLKYYFVYRCTAAWNSLPDDVFNTNLTECFRRKLHNLDFSTFMRGTL